VDDTESVNGETVSGTERKQIQTVRNPIRPGKTAPVV
jgi:hypothetical protein